MSSPRSACLVAACAGMCLAFVVFGCGGGGAPAPQVGTVQGYVFRPASPPAARAHAALRFGDAASPPAGAVPMQGAGVTVQGTAVAATTDAQGLFILTDVPAGPQTVVASHPDYLPATASVAVAAGQTATVVPLSQTSRYVGTATCQTCHPMEYSEWKGSLHSKMIQRATDPGALVADPAAGGLNPADVVYTIGNYYKQRYLTLIGTEYYILPRDYTIATRKWGEYNPTTWQQKPWRTECMGCHTTGFDEALPAPNKFIEIAIGCEECHGPGANHAQSPSVSNIVTFSALSAHTGSMICGACHIRGRDPSGKYAFPVTFEPAQDLDSQFVPIMPGSADLWPDGSAKSHRQQYIDLENSTHWGRGVGCLDCHAGHSSSYRWSTIANPDDNSPCNACHGLTGNLLATHTHHDPNVQVHKGSLCVSCHMPLIAKSAVKWDIHSHHMKFISPQKSIDTLGKTDVMPNSCMAGGCHSAPVPGKIAPVWAYNQTDLQAALAQVKQWWPAVR